MNEFAKKNYNYDSYVTFDFNENRLIVSISIFLKPELSSSNNIKFPKTKCYVKNNSTKHSYYDFNILCENGQTTALMEFTITRSNYQKLAQNVIEAMPQFIETAFERNALYSERIDDYFTRNQFVKRYPQFKELVQALG